jgi:glycosyltransferase involved in cell wall biosynthesis
MRLIHIVPAISEEASGPSYSVTRLCEALLAQGQQATLATLDWTALPSPPAFLQTFPLGWGPRRLGRSPAMLDWLSEAAHSGAVDLLHNHSLWMMPNVYPSWVARQRGTPLVVSPRGTLSAWAMRSGSKVKRLFWPLLQRPALSAAACFHATAMAEYEDIRRAGLRQPVAVIPNGIDLPAVPPKTPGGQRTLLFLGRIHPVKGLDVLLPAWQAVQARFPEWRLQIAGPDNGGYLAQMQALASALGLQRVEFCGALFGEQKWQAYAQADVFVLPTYSENFGMAVAEALAAGTPAMVSKGAPWEDVQKHQAGWWVDIGLEPLVAGLEDALSRPIAELTAMGNNGRRLVEQHYAWPQIGRQMAETYRWIVQGGNAPAWVIED